MVKEISKSMSSNYWYSTQTTAFSLMAISAYVGKTMSSNSFSFSITIDGKTKHLKSSMPIYVHKIKKFSMKGINISVNNTNSKAYLFYVATAKGSSAAGMESESASGLSLSVNYYDNNGYNLGVSDVRQGKDFSVDVSVTNTSVRKYENIVLSHIIPSGWQIHNTRFETGTIATNADYQDFRDDRVYTYFSLRPGESKRFKVMINASFAGKYYMPGISVEAMYDAAISEVKKGQWVRVNR